MVVEQARHCLRAEDALPANGRRRERLARVGLERGPQPLRRGQGESLLASTEDLGWYERRKRLPQQSLLPQVANLRAGRKRECEARQQRVEKRNARLERVSHACAVDLHEQLVDEVRPDIEVEDAAQLFGALA